MSMRISLLCLVLTAVLPGSVNADCPAGDLNGDCRVDLLDLKMFAEQWLAPPDSAADLNSDDDVDLTDLALLAASWHQKGTALIISEFMAVNGSKQPLGKGELLDEDGSSSDWIEIYNPTEAAVNLDGWYLTDDADNMRKWEFPAVEISPAGFLVVFASGKDRRDPDSELHTNFQLQAGGEFLALVHPEGDTIAQAYDEYPPQLVDLSYGLSGGTGSTSTDTTLIPEFTAAKALIPVDGSLRLSWTEPGFDDSVWLSGTTGVGYDYTGLIGLDVGAMRYNNQTVYVRIGFEVSDISAIDRLTLRMKYEDGFVAYINGIPIASFGVDDPENMSWNAGSDTNRSDTIAQVFEEFNATDHIGALRVGDNILAVHGLNVTLSSSDLLVLPELVATNIETMDIPSTVEGYLYEPTPGGENSGIGANLGPAIRNVTENPPQPSDDEDLIITAEVKETFDPIREVRLFGRINFDISNRWLPSQGVLMIDDGTEADTVAGDGIYTAVIPFRAHNPGDMVRWKVTAEDTKGNTSRYPLFLYSDNSPEYFGTVVEDPSISTQLPVIEWFVQNVSASESDSGTRGSVYYLGEFYDNIVIHRRGGSTASNPWNDKTHFKFRFNRGYKFRFDPDKPRVNEFNLNCTYSDKAYLRQNLAFEAYDWCGCPGSESFLMRAQRNGQFYGVQVFIEEPEEELLEREGLDPDGALYKMYSTFTSPGEKKTRRWEGTADISNFISSINNTSGTTLHNNIFDRVNLPLTLNYLVATVITHQNDHPHKNHYLYRDSDGSGEWFFLPWDHDLTWGSNWTGSSYHDYIYADDDQVPGKPTTVKPSHPFVGKQDCQEWNYHWNRLTDALLNDATVREMYLRRLRTVMDKFLKAPGTPYNELFIENRIDELVAKMAPDVAFDYVKWADPWTWGGQGGYPRDQVLQYAIDVIKNDYLAVRRAHLFVTHNVNNIGSYNISGSYSAAIPNAQPADPTINFGGYDYNPISGNQDEEYVQLINPNSYAVDISGWKLTGAVEHEFLPGTVIIAGGSLYVCPDAAAFRSRVTSPTGGQGGFVQGNYKGHLSSWGETINLTDNDGTLVNTITYLGNPSDQQRYLRITEMMYHPADPCEGSLYNDEAFEYIELKNIGTAPLSLGGVKFTEGIFFTFPSISLPAGDYMVVVKNQAAFVSRHTLPGSIQIFGPYQGQLSNSSEAIKLEDSTNSTILEYDYEDNWYDITDGSGFSLTVKDPVNTKLNDWGRKKYWRPSANIGGSPGWDDVGQVPELGSVKINELLAHSHSDESDWIELHNTTGAPINIGGWFLSDSRDNFIKYEIADGTTIDPCGYIVFDEDLHFGNPDDSGCIEPFALSENGETLYLHSGQDGVLTGYSEEEKFGASETGVSFGRYLKSTGSYNFVPMSKNTPGSANAYPKVGPLIISEIMYNPDWPAGGSYTNDQYEYVELHNISAESVTLYRDDKGEPWKFTDGIEFTFPDQTPVTITAGGYLLLVKKPEAFSWRYPAVPVEKILGPYDGKLSNAGERLELSMPGDVDKFGVRQYIRIDRVTYSDGFHPEDCPGGVDLWPIAPDGNGKSLTRKVLTDYGNDPTNWTAAIPSPGE